MQLTIYKVYNRVVHSYLAVLEIEQTGSEDPNIFVCKDLPANAPIPPAPPQSSGMDQESSFDGEGSSSGLEEAISSSENGISSLEEVSSTEQSSEVSDGSPAMEGTSAWSSEQGLYDQASSEEPSEVSSEPSLEESSEESSSATPLFTVYPARTLVSIASLTDLDVLPLAPTAPGGLYRASTVAMIFRSMTHMNRVMNQVVSDVLINAEIQRVPIEDYEVVELQDPVFGQDEDRIYYFR